MLLGKEEAAYIAKRLTLKEQEYQLENMDQQDLSEGDGSGHDTFTDTNSEDE